MHTSNKKLLTARHVKSQIKPRGVKGLPTRRYLHNKSFFITNNDIKDDIQKFANVSTCNLFSIISKQTGLNLAMQ